MDISDDRLQKALTYLATTDEEAAQAKAYMAGLEDQKKTVFSVELLKASGSVEVKKAESHSSPAYIQHAKLIQQSIYDYEVLRNKRLTEALIVEVWRSCNANRRNGNIT